LLNDRNLQKKTNKKTHKVTYEVSNDRNFQTKHIKKHVPSSLAQVHLTNDVGTFFIVIKVENGLTWFLICFSKKKI